jgi:hypothetical protein
MAPKARCMMRNSGELRRRCFCLAACLAERHVQGRKRGTTARHGHESLWGTACFLIMSGKILQSFTRRTLFVAAILGPLSGRSGHYPADKTG